MKKLCWLILLTLLVTLGVQAKEKLTPEELAYLGKAEACQLTFTIPADQAPEVWGRAVYLFTVLQQDFVFGTHTGLVVDAQDYCLRLKTSYSSYRINKLPKADGTVTYVVSVDRFILGSDKDKLRNKHIIAYYLQTGEIMGKLFAGL